MERVDAMEEGLQSAAARPLLLAETSSSESFKPASDHSLTPLLVFSSFVSLWGSFSYGCAVGYSSPAESGIMEDLGLSVAAYSVFGSILTIGGMVGAILSGKMTDLIGRRGTMWICQVVCMAGWLAIAFAKNAWCVDIGRFVVGVAVGILTYVVPVYISEIAPKNLRGRFTSASQLLVCCGSAVAFLAGSVVSWRALSLIATIPNIVQFVGLFFVPESPRWLIPVSIVTILLMDFFGRRTLLMVSATTSCLSLLLVGLSFCLQEIQYLKELSTILAVVGLMGYGCGFALGMSGIPWVIMAEIFPVNIKASAGSLVVLNSWASAWVMTYAFNFMLEWSPAGTFFIFCGMCAFTIFFIWKLVPETKGRALEEIQSTMTTS